MIALAKDHDFYKYWVGHDGRSWSPSHALLDREFRGHPDNSGLNASMRWGPKS